MAKDNLKSPDAQQARFDGTSGGMNTGVALIGFILCFIAGMGLMWGYDKHQMGKGGIMADSSAGGAVWSDDESPIPVSSKDPTWGSRTAPVTIVEFSDFQCPFCGRVEPTLEQVKTTYGPDKVRIIWKNEPLSFHDKAKPAAEAAMGVFALKGNDGFWKFHDTAYKNQGALSADSYEKWAKDAGVTDMAKWKTGITNHTWAKKVEDDHDLAHKAGVNGTPAFYVNGVSISGAQPFDKFKTIIDEELKKAQAKIASGTPKERIYVAMSTDNKKNGPAPKDDEGDEKKDDTTVFKVPIGNAAILGNKNAPVTIVEFSDFQCPFCKRVEPTLKQVRDTYGDKVRLVWKHEPLPFHPRAEPAAELTMEARAEKGDAGFWAAHDKLFDQQPKLDDADLEKAAGDLGLNVDKVKDAIKSHKYKKDIDVDSDLSEDLQASGTPHFFINGRRLVGAQPFEKFKAVIDDELKKTADMKSKGIADDKIYETIIKDGKGAPEPEKKNVTPPTSGPWKGNEKAKVVIQEFSDFQCPFCGRVEPTVQEVMKNYGDKVKFVWRDKPLPMHADAPLASQAAREAFKQKGSDGFWKMHDILFQNQSKEGGLKRPALDGYAQQLGLDMDKWKTALDTGSHKPEVDAEDKVGTDAGITGTPAFIINGYYISGAQPYPKFKKLIERALADANK